MARARIELTVDNKRARQGIGEVSKDLRKASKEAREGIKLSPKKDPRRTLPNASKTDTAPGTSSRVVQGLGNAVARAGVFNGIGSVTGLGIGPGMLAFGGIAAAAVGLVSRLDIFKNKLGEVTSWLGGAFNSGEKSVERGAALDALDDRARRTGVQADEMFGIEETMKNNFGATNGQQMLDRTGTFVSNDLTSGGKKLHEMGFSFTEMKGLDKMNDWERFMTVMTKLKQLNESGKENQATSLFSDVAGVRNAKFFKQAVGMIEIAEKDKNDFAAAFLNNFNGSTPEEKRISMQTAISENAEVERIQTQAAAQSYAFTPDMQQAAIRQAEAQLADAKAATAGVNSGAYVNNGVDAFFDDRKTPPARVSVPPPATSPSPFDEPAQRGDPFANTPQLSPDQRALNRQEYASGVGEIVGAIKTSPQPRASNAEQPSTFA